MMSYLSRLWVAIDVLLNVIAVGQVETISSRCGKQIVAGNPCRVCSVICRLLNVFWPDHCIHNRIDPLK